MNKQELITRLESMLLYYNKQYEISHYLSMRSGVELKNYHEGRRAQLTVILEDLKKLLKEVKSLEVGKERKLIKVVEYYE